MRAEASPRPPADTAEAAWRRRFRAARMSLPAWARDDPEHLLYVSNASGTWELYAWDRRAGVHRQVTDRPDGTYSGRLDPSGRLIWWFDDHRGNEFGAWMVEPFGGESGPRPAAPGIDQGYSAGLALASSFAVIGVSNDEGVSVHLVQGGEATRLLYRHREDASVGGLSRDEDLVCLRHSEGGDSRHPDLLVVDLDGAEVAELSDGPGRGLWPGGWSRVPGDRRVIVLHERRDLPRPLLWWPETGETVELDIDLPGEVDASWYPDGAALLIHHDHEGRSGLYRLDLSSGALESLGVESGAVIDARVRPDGEVWYSWSRSDAPAQIRGPRGVLVAPLGDPAPAGVRYSDRRAGGVPMFVAEPEGRRPHPTMVLIHGGPEHHDGDWFSPQVQALVDHGLAVVLVNYRGSSGYGKAWRDAITGNPGLVELEDIAKAHDAIVAEGIADRSRVALGGASWGGYLTLLALGLQPERWALGIADVPVGDYVAAYEDEMEPLKAYDRALFGGSPETIPDAYRERSPITYADRIRAPLLILAGENDPRCPIRQVENYIARLEALGKAYEVYRYDAGHGSLVVERTIEMVEIQLAFLARHLGTRPPA